MTRIAEIPVDMFMGSAKDARAFVAATLVAWRLEHISRQAVLVGHELVANALRHGAPPITIRLLRGQGSVSIEVTDAGDDLPRLVEIDNDTSTSGRGLRIVEMLSRRWGIRRSPASKTVWAELPTEEGGGGQTPVTS